MRNLINIKDNSYVVFLFPTKNKRINKQAEFAKSNLIKSGFKQNIINLTWEHLLGFIDSINLDSDKLGAHMVDFKEKYRIDPIRY